VGRPISLSTHISPNESGHLIIVAEGGKGSQYDDDSAEMWKLTSLVEFVELCAREFNDVRCVPVFSEPNESDP